MTISLLVAGLLLGGCGEGAAPGVKPVRSPLTTGLAPVPSPTSSSSSSSTQGDGGPHEADNNGWKQRGEPTAGDRASAVALVARLRPALERVRRAGDVSPDATRAAVLRLGVKQDRLEVVAFRQGVSATTPPGAVISVYVGDTACVVGDVRLQRSTAEVLGRAAEYGCLEPFSH